MPNRLFSVSILIALSILGSLLCPSVAFAGFQWTPPAETPIQAPPSPNWVPPSSSATTAPEVISPVIIEGKPSSSSATLSVAPAAPPATTSRENHLTMHPLLPPSSATVTPASTTTLPATPPEPVVRGFAKQVPLAVALRQILPAGYGFSVDPDVDLGVLISFQGGKPWRETLAGALEPAGLVMHERNQMVSIGRAGSSSASLADKSANMVTTPTASTTAPAHILEAPGEAISTPPFMAGNSMSSSSNVWEAERGDSLHKVVEGWAQRSNVELNWMAEYDYPIQASFNYTGSFEDAVRNLLTGFEEAHPQPIAELHTNSSLGQRVLVVQTRGNSTTN